jgi:hypothetical protein
LAEFFRLEPEHSRLFCVDLALLVEHVGLVLDLLRLLAEGAVGEASRDDRECGEDHFTDPSTWAAPGGNLYIFDLQGLGVGTVWTVAASATELKPPNRPYIGDAAFLTNGVEFNQPEQRAFVSFYVDWPDVFRPNLPVAIMMTIGWLPG